jgi:hypothetical protein
MVDGISADDGGSMYVQFTDARGAEKKAVLKTNLDAVDYTNVGLGEGHESVPYGGVDERAFLSLLEQWYARTPEAQEWNARIERFRRSKDYSEISKGMETGAGRGSLFGVNILMELRRRNRPIWTDWRP